MLLGPYYPDLTTRALLLRPRCSVPHRERSWHWAIGLLAASPIRTHFVPENYFTKLAVLNSFQYTEMISLFATHKLANYFILSERLFEANFRSHKISLTCFSAGSALHTRGGTPDRLIHGPLRPNCPVVPGYKFASFQRYKSVEVQVVALQSRHYKCSPAILTIRHKGQSQYRRLCEKINRRRSAMMVQPFCRAIAANHSDRLYRIDYRRV